jgi:hypothetical protein
MENKKNIYGNSNPVFESFKNLIESEKNNGKEKKSESTDSQALLATILNNTFTILLNSKMENLKTVRGFQEVKNKILGSSNFSTFRQYVLSLLKAFEGMDLDQKESYEKNIKFITNIFSNLELLISDPKVYNSNKVGIISKMLGDFEKDLKDREAQMKKTDPKIYADAVKKGIILKESDENEEGEFRGKAFNKSKESLDSATAFLGLVERDKYIAILKDNSDLKKYEEIAKDLLQKAKNIQLTDREGISKVVTPTGTFKSIEYKRQQDILINDIIRQKKEYEKIKNSIIKKSPDLSIISTEIPDPVCPVGMVYNKEMGACVSIDNENDKKDQKIKKEEKKAEPVNCEFPIKIGAKKCEKVGELQKRLMDYIPSAKEYLGQEGGSDMIYGKATAKVTNIVWGYLSKNNQVPLDGDLTSEIYDRIMKMEKTWIILDNENRQDFFKNRINESEEKLKTSVLNFNNFSSALSEVKWEPYFKDSCVKSSISSDKIEDCLFGGGWKDDEKEKEKEDKKEKEDNGEKDKNKEKEEFPPSREEWQGIKYVATGTYPVSFDESLLSYWTKEIALTAATMLLPGSGLILKAGTTGTRSLAIRGATKVGAEKLAARLAGEELVAKTVGERAAVRGSYFSSVARRLASTKTPMEVADQMSAISSGFFRRYKKIPIPKRAASGIIGGTLGSAALDFISGRDSFTIEVIEGFIDRNIVLNMSSGLVNTLDGYVSDDDWSCISTILAVIKGSWTLDESGNPVSSWKLLKETYKNKEGEDLVEDIKSVSPKAGEVEGYPKLKSSNPLAVLSEMDWDFAYNETVGFISRLESNESKLALNLKKIPKSYIKALEDGEFAEYDENGEIEGMEIGEDEKESEKIKKEEKGDLGI